LLVVIAIIGALAGFLVPTVMSARKKAKRMECLNNLKQLGSMLMSYSDDNAGWFPKASGKNPLAYLSFQKFVDGSTSEVPPKMFVCPESRDETAELNDKKKYTLEEVNNSYAYVGSKTSNTDPGSRALAADDSIRGEGVDENHEGGINVVYVGMNAEWVKQNDLGEGRSFPEGLVDNEGNTGGN